MGDLAVDTAVEGNDGHYHARLSPAWEVWGPNGGYVASIALRAAAAATPLRRPASFACHFLSVAEFDAVDLAVTPLRTARRAVSLRVSMTQRTRPILEAFAWFIGEVEGLAHDAAVMPTLPGPDGLKSIDELVPPEEQAPFPFWQNLEVRPTRFVPPKERTADQPVLQSWYRFRPRATFDDPALDAARMLLLIDTLQWPAAFRAYDNPSYVAPSIDLAVQFHRLAPAVEWLLADAVSPVATDGLVGGRVTVWSPDGRLLASGASQLLCRPAPPLH